MCGGTGINNSISKLFFVCNTGILPVVGEGFSFEVYQRVS
jgi:hypothetical protein